jgi:uncharacterized protein involved in outer membrane biogenesis
MAVDTAIAHPLRRIALALVAGLAALLALASLVLALLDFSSEREMVQRALERFTGQPVEVGEINVRLSWRGRLMATCGPIRAHLDPASGDGYLFEVESVDAGVDLWSYIWHGDIVVGPVYLDSPRLILVKRADGTWNWRSMGAHQAPAVEHAARAALVNFAGQSLLISELRLSNVVLTTRNLAVDPATQYEYRNLWATVALSDRGENLDVSASIEADSAAAGGEPLALTGTIAGVLLAPTAESPHWNVDATVQCPNAATRNVAVLNLSGHIAVAAGELLRIDDLKAGMGGGDVTGLLEIALAERAHLFRTRARAEGVDLATLLRPRPDLAANLGGKLSGQIDVRGEMGDFETALGSLDGNCTATLRSGTIASVDMVSIALGQMGFLARGGGATRFQRLDGDFRLKPGRIEFSGTKVVGLEPGVDVTLSTGSLTLAKAPRVEAVGQARVSVAVLRGLGTAGGVAELILRMAGTGSLNAPFAVNGPLDKPAVEVKWRDTLNPLSKLPFP